GDVLADDEQDRLRPVGTARDDLDVEKARDALGRGRDVERGGLDERTAGERLPGERVEMLRLVMRKHLARASPVEALAPSWEERLGRAVHPNDAKRRDLEDEDDVGDVLDDRAERGRELLRLLLGLHPGRDVPKREHRSGELAVSPDRRGGVLDGER